MAVDGDNIPQAIFLQGFGGSPLIYASKTDFQAAGWDISWRDASDVALTTQPTWTLGAGAANGRHALTYTLPDGPWTARLTVPNPAFVASPLEFDGEGSVYDIDSIGSIIVTSTAIAVAPTVIEGTAELFDGNSIRLDFSVPEAALTAIGASSLATCDTLVAEIKLDSADSSAAPPVTTLTETIITDISGTRLVRGTLATFPAALAVPAGGQQTLACTAHLLLTKGSSVITGSVIRITVKWKANTI